MNPVLKGGGSLGHNVVKNEKKMCNIVSLK